MRRDERMGNNRESRMGMRGNGKSRRNSPRISLDRRKWVIVWIVIPWVLVFVNAFLMLRMRGQVGELDNQVNYLQSRLMAAMADQVLSDENAMADAEMAVPESVNGAVDGPITSYADLWGLEQVDKPRERTQRQILERLQELGEDSELIAQVAEAHRYYPDRLLEALANNPEMADFAAHYLENKGSVTGEGLTDSEKGQEFSLFLQWDPRWGYASYGDNSVVGLSGCGPTALSMVLYYLTGNEELTPDVLAEYSMREGYYISGTGTAWLLFEDVPPMYGISVSQPEKNELVMQQALDRGDLIICSMGPGDFTIGGHFVVVYGYSDEGFLLNDPNCVARSRRAWFYSELGGRSSISGFSAREVR